MKHTQASAGRRRFLQFGAGLALAGSIIPAWAASTPANTMSSLEAINQAGRQRMLSQRMAKLYSQIIRDVRTTEARKLLGDSMALFEKQLLNLRGFAQQKSAPDIVATYDTLSTLWLEYKQVVGGLPSVEGLRQVATLNEQVLATANAGTLQFEKLHGGALGKLVNMSGRQRMLSQRMSKFYFFRRDGLNTPDIGKGLEAARTEFIAALKTLKNAPENTSDINSWIAMAESQWLFFEEGVRSDLGNKSELEYHDNNVAITSENILQVMDKLTNLYTALS